MQEFNKGVYDYIIASDEGVKKGEQDSDESGEEDVAEASDDECASFAILVYPKITPLTFVF